MRVLVTGGAGFIGSHLCDALLQRGDEVLCLDNFFTGQRRNVTALLANRDFELIRHDVTDAIHLEVDHIYHLACPAAPVHYQFDPVKTVTTCVKGTINMLDVAVRVHGKLVLASTSEVYGDPAQHPQTEEYWGNVNPIGPRSCYDEGKRVAETLASDFRRQYGVDVRIARIFNTYGPRMLIDDGRVVSNFITQALRGDDITVYGDGTQTRSFCFVRDLVEGLIALMNAPGTIETPVNLGNPHELTMNELATEVLARTKSTSKLVRKPQPVDDPTRRQPDITKARTLLGWSPKTSLADGLDQTVKYFEWALKEPDQRRVRAMRR